MKSTGNSSRNGNYLELYSKKKEKLLEKLILMLQKENLTKSHPKINGCKKRLCTKNTHKFFSSFSMMGKSTATHFMLAVSRSSHRSCSEKKLFLKISQYSQAKTCVGASF